MRDGDDDAVFEDFFIKIQAGSVSGRNVFTLQPRSASQSLARKHSS